MRGLLILGLLIVLSCSHSQKHKNNESASAVLPHSNFAPTVDFSEKDKIQLATAKGKTIDTISMSRLKKQISSESEGLHIYNFWSSDCEECIHNLDTLNQLQTTSRVEEVEIVHICLDDIQEKEALNTLIRSKSIVGKAYLLVDKNANNWFNEVEKSWNGTSPLLLFINNLDDTHLYYTGTYSMEELQVIIEPFLIM